MPTAVWSGAISFGLVTIPIKVFSATEDRSISFHRIHLEDGGRVRNRKVCEVDAKVVDQSEVGKGYELGNTIVQVSDAELAEIPLPTAKAIEIAAFVPADSIDPVRISDSYYLAADGQVAAKPYVLLRQALERSEKVAVAKFAWHGRERLGLLRVKNDAIVLHSMKWPDEVRSPAELAPAGVDLDEDELQRAIDLMDSMTTDTISGYRDHYREALEELIAAKAEGQAPPGPAEAGKATGGGVVDLMAALNASVQRARESRGESDEHATVHEMQPSKKTTKKAATKKATPAKKTTRRKPKSA
ncbi:Ku protein (plasmid) [Streptomyces sp. NBC_01527]|uniref:non-homologous end joining protein Ku n=1 Tax=Streptomyces sp. NBC_01527 TaxID=2903894 RepID=UPI002F908CDD